MFAHHVFEILDHLESDFVFRVAEIHERARVDTALRKDDFDRRIRIRRNGLVGPSATNAPANQDN
jgi:hypothetical protein